MAFRLALSEGAKADLQTLRASDQKRVGDQMQRQLAYQPDVETRNRKPLRMEEGLLPFEHVPPVWELKVGSFRVYYDVDRGEQIVNVRAVRLKPPHRTTKESLREDDRS